MVDVVNVGEAQKQTPMEGILVVDKPAGFTSFDVVAKLRGLCKTRKIGHGGTLDPMATGVLPVFIGAAAKAVDLQPRQDKTYEAVFLFGTATDTGDITGNVLRTMDCDVPQAALEAALARFAGEIEQVPPMYSAVKVNGKPLYRYAREGKTVERKPRRVNIYDIRCLEKIAENRFLVRVHCSKGTYIRTLAEDVAAVLGVPATLAALRRTGAGVFGAEDMHGLPALAAAAAAGTLGEHLLAVEAVFMELPALDVDENAKNRLLNGAAVPSGAAPGRYRARHGGRFLGLVRVSPGGEMRAEKLFWRE